MYLDTYKIQLTELCKTYNVKHLFAFGSVLTNNFNEKSDIDLLEEKALKNSYLKKRINQSKL